MICSTFERGLNEESGFWKTICICRRVGRRSFLLTFVISSPSKTTCPDVGSMSLRIIRPSVVFPHPDSPTRPSASPEAMVRSTPSQSGVLWENDMLLFCIQTLIKFPIYEIIGSNQWPGGIRTSDQAIMRSSFRIQCVFQPKNNKSGRFRVHSVYDLQSACLCKGYSRDTNSSDHLPYGLVSACKMGQ